MDENSVVARMSFTKLQAIFVTFVCKLWTSGDLGGSMPWASDAGDRRLLW